MPYFHWNVPLNPIPLVWQQTSEPSPILQQWSLILEFGIQSHPGISLNPKPGQPSKTKSTFKMFMIFY